MRLISESPLLLVAHPLPTHLAQTSRLPARNTATLGSGLPGVTLPPSPPPPGQTAHLSPETGQAHGVSRGGPSPFLPHSHRAPPAGCPSLGLAFCPVSPTLCPPSPAAPSLPMSKVSHLPQERAGPLSPLGSRSPASARGAPCKHEAVWRGRGGPAADGREVCRGGPQPEQGSQPRGAGGRGPRDRGHSGRPGRRSSPRLGTVGGQGCPRGES